MRWPPPTCFPPAPQLSRRSYRVIRPCENRVASGTNSKTPGRPSPAPAGSAVRGFDTLQDSRILKAAVQNRYLHVGVTAPSLCLLYFVWLHPLREGGSSGGSPLLPRRCQLSTPLGANSAPRRLGAPRHLHPRAFPVGDLSISKASY